MTFENLEFKNLTHRPGIQAIVHFPNNYGASIVQSPYSYGGENGLYELAVLFNNDICYDTPITSDVLGYLKPEDVTEYLEQIEKL